jgi:hypothetical protein
MYLSFYQHLIYKFLLQLSVLFCTYFSLNKLHFCYKKQLTFVNLTTVTCKLHGKLIFDLQIFTLWRDFMKQISFANQSIPVYEIWSPRKRKENSILTSFLTCGLKKKKLISHFLSARSLYSQFHSPAVMKNNAVALEWGVFFSQSHLPPVTKTILWPWEGLFSC